MKKYILSFLLLFAFTLSMSAFNYGGVWIEHFAINIDVGHNRSFSITPQNNGTVTATSWDGRRIYTGTVGVYDNNQIIIYSSNGNVTLDRFDWSGEWTDVDNERFLIRHERKNYLSILNSYSNQVIWQGYFKIQSNNCVVLDGNIPLNRQSAIDTANGLNAIGDFLDALWGD